MKTKSEKEMRQELMELGMYRLLNHYQGDVKACVQQVLEDAGPENEILKFAGSDPAKWWAAHQRTKRRIAEFETDLTSLCPHRWITPEGSYTRCEICGALPPGQTPDAMI